MKQSSKPVRATQKPDENGNTEGGFWQRITGFFRGFIDWFLRLFKWFGKK